VDLVLVAARDDGDAHRANLLPRRERLQRKVRGRPVAGRGLPRVDGPVVVGVEAELRLEVHHVANGRRHRLHRRQQALRAQRVVAASTE
jgi:hypothetical protein